MSARQEAFYQVAIYRIKIFKIFQSQIVGETWSVQFSLGNAMMYAHRLNNLDSLYKYIHSTCLLSEQYTSSTYTVINTEISPSEGNRCPNIIPCENIKPARKEFHLLDPTTGHENH